jgi:hypothetical protein
MHNPLRSKILVLALLAIAGSAAARAAAACQTAGQTFVLVVDHQTSLGAPASYAVGQSTTYSINCAPPNSEILWSSTLNGSSTGENRAYYGQNTDANGHWSAAGGAWAEANLGAWTKTATVGSAAETVAFTVTPQLTVNGLVTSIGAPTYTVGQQTTYTVSGAPPSSPIYWSSTRNGASTGEVYDYYGQSTDAGGNWSGTGGAWASANVGLWTKTATFGSPSASSPQVTVAFQVISTCTLFPPASGTTGSNSYSARLGAYDWPNNACLIDSGANQMATIGAHVARILFDAQCTPSQQSLLQVLSGAQMQAAINNPNLTTIILTVFDRTTCGNNAQIYVDPTYYQSSTNNNAVIADYQSLTEQLYSQYHGSGKTFIIDNWEGDNAVYCSDAYDYGMNPATQAACDANYAALYKGVPNAAQGIAGFKSWATARQQGVANGKSWAVANGLTSGIQVDYAIEFNIVHALQNAGFESVLDNVVLSVPHDYASYSAYESTNISAAQLTTDLDSLRTTLGNSNVIIGEFGFSEAATGASQQQVRQKSDAIINAAIAWGVPYIIQWVVFDNDQFGLYDFGATPQAMACYFQSRYSGAAYPSVSCN